MTRTHRAESSPRFTVTAVAGRPARRFRAWVPRACVALAFLIAPPTDSYAFDAQQLLTQLAQSRQGQATFVETKYLAMLDRPIRSSGTLAFQAPARFEKATLEPKREVLVLDGDTLTVAREGRTITVDLRDHVQVLSFVEAIRGVLLGNAERLEQLYKIQLSGTEAAWNIVLTPRDSKLADLIKEIRMSGGGGQVRSVEYAEAGGDRSVMQIEPVPLKDRDPDRD